MSAPADVAARTDIELALEETLFVEAGAGSGKTYELVERVANLVAAGADPRRLAVITFTEAAAAELRERVRERLTIAAKTDADPVRRDHAEAALATLDDAVIGTLHAFAQRILSEFPVEAGLPPGFEVLDEIEAAIAFDDRWRKLCDRIYADPQYERALTVAAVLGAHSRRLMPVARQLDASWDLARDWRPAAAPVPDFDAKPVLDHLDAAIARSDACCADDDTLLAHLEGLEVLAGEVRNALDPLEALEILAAAPKLSAANKGKKPNWPNGAKDEVLAHLVAAEAARANALTQVLQPTLTTLLGAIAQFVRDSVEARRSEGRVQFHDLLVFAVELVRRNPSVRARLHERFEHVLLDEFQDTDPIQIELAVLITSTDDDAGTKPWHECKVGPGRLFVVGDPKQSIYRFRRADIELYRRVREIIGEREGRRVLLTTNFRSRPGILELVNDVFTSLMLDDDPLQAPYAALAPDRGPCTTTPDPVRTFGTEAAKGSDLAEIRRTEARELAAIVRRVRDEGWQVRDDATGGTRDARFDDIAVLMPTRLTLPYLEEALEEADIPARIESQSLVFATSDVRELLQVLQAIDDPVNDVAIVAALRSPGFACSDNDLVQFRRAGGSWDYRVEAPADLSSDHPVVAGMRDLLALHERRWWDGVSELVERVIRERRLLELAVERQRPRDHWRRVRFVADAARAYADRGGTSLRGFVEWAIAQADEEARAVEVIVPEPDDDAVRVLTVHGAKGLEFPIVLLTGLGVGDMARTGAVLFGPDGPEVRVSYGDGSHFLTAAFDELKKTDLEAQRAEQIRLLYVALTRAQDHLVISMHRRVDDKCLARLLADATASRPELTGSAGKRSIREPISAQEAASVPDRLAWIEARAARIDAVRRAPTVAATALAHAADEELDLLLERDEAQELPPWRRGRAGTAIGRAVHAVLQTVDLTTGDGLDATARAQALAEGIPAREPEIAALAGSVLATPVVRGLDEPDARCWREVPVAARVEGVLVEGFIDLLVETADGLTVVDYKTDPAPSDEALDAVVRRYTAQAAAYVVALESVLGRPVARCVLVFARSGGAVERTIDDLPAAITAVRRQIAATT